MDAQSLASSRPTWGRYLSATLLVGIAVNVYDYLVHDVVLLHALYAQLPIMRYGGATSQRELVADAAVPLFVGLDIVAAAIFVAVYAWVRPQLPHGWRGGALFGLVVGILVNVPTWAVCALQLNGFPGRLAVAWTAAGLGWALVAGFVAAGALALGDGTG